MPPYVARIPPTRQLQPIDLVAPGFRGLNLSESAGVLAPSFCTEAMNGVLDTEGRLQARDGLTSVTSTPIPSSPVIRTLFEYINNAGNAVTIVAWNGGISNSLSDPAGNDISGAVTDANGTWKFVNFNGKVIGFQAGVDPIVWNGSGNFAHVVETSGTSPTGGIGTAAFGRVWGVDADLQTIKYSALLDELAWTTGAGLIDMRNIWPNGTDIVRAIEAFNGQLVVWGRRTIVFFAATSAGALGLDPATLYVADTISGIGCLTQFSLQSVGETDRLFLSSEGVQSLARLIVQKSNPVANLSKYVRDALLGNVQAETVDNIRSTYNPLTGFYALSLPVSKVTWVLDQRRRWTDDVGDQVAITTRWSIAPTAMYTRLDNSLIASIGGGKVTLYSGSSDDTAVYRFIYQSPWLDLGEELANRIKILKRLGAILFVANDTGVIFKWSADFRNAFKSASRTALGSGSVAAEWGIAEYGIGEYGGGIALRILKLPAPDVGQYFRIGVEANVTGKLSLQQAELFAKIGRIA